jgi:site-specific DNA-methyltransferase (adenine-specific)
MQTTIELEKGAALDWLQGQEAGSFQCLILDPPYNVGYRYATYRDALPDHEYLHEQLLVLARAKRLLKPGGSLWYLQYPEALAELWARVDFLTKVDWVAWVYHAHTGGAPLRKASRAWAWFAQGLPKVNPEAFQGEYRNPEDPRIRERLAQGHKPVGYDWLDFEQVKNTSAEKRGHPCQLPQAMVEKLIQATTAPGDLVGDCYAGSGTTALAAQKLGRAFKGCDLDQGYVDLARKALEEKGNPEAQLQISDLA